MIREHAPADIPDWEHREDLGPLDRALLGPTSPWLEKGQVRVFSLEDGGRLLARVAALINPELQDQAEPTGQLGFFSFSDEAFEQHETGLVSLMERSMSWLSGRGMKRVRAPMNFTTWYSYRARSLDSDYPTFPGETVLDSRYARFFETFMQPVGTYASHLIEDHEKAQAMARKLRIDRAAVAAGLTIEEVTREAVLGNMQMFFDLASQIFPQDFSYGPISFAEYQQLYGPILQHAPDFFGLIAREAGGRPVGLVYGYRHPDAQVKTSILKTVGILREYQGRGLSRSIAWNLTYEYHMRLIRRGYENFIHALMKEDNASRAMSDRFAKKIREYRLYEAALTGPWPGRDRPRVPSTLTFSISRPLTERIALRRWSRRSR